MPETTRLQLSWQRLFPQAILSIYAYLFMEWLFFATKPSFMDALPLGARLEVFLLTGFVILELTLPGLVVLRLLGLIPGPTRRWRVFLILAAILPAFFLSILSLLLLDNFTYTLFKVGIVTSQGFVRGGYGVLGLILFAVWYRQTLLSLRIPSSPAGGTSSIPPKPSARQNASAWLGIFLVAISLFFGLVRLSEQINPISQTNNLIRNQPNIVLLGGDGLVASQMSVYGYARDTTPNLRKLAQTGLLAENNFTNSASTTGSIISILTGKYPAQTRLLYSPNILQGEDAYQHLPGILERLGYTTVEITFPYYIDAYDLNLQEGFDQVNGRSIDHGKIFQLARRFHLEEAGYFLPRLYQRISDRLLHIFFIRSMPDPYRQVIQAVNPNAQPQLRDQERIDELILLLDTAQAPVFAHVHLMDTHGGKFFPRQRVFSAGEKQDQEWMIDFYDDAVLDFDAYVGELVSALSDKGLLDRTILVIYSDHADQWQSEDKIPLLFRFPGGEHAGKIHNNTQNLDIAPTLLDYLGMEIPGWMSGQSLLQGEPPSTRPIISASVVGVDCDRPGWWCILDPPLVHAPFYQFGYLQVVVCQKMVALDLNQDQLSESLVKGHTTPCDPSSLPSRDQVRDILLEHLQENGFDTATLK